MARDLVTNIVLRGQEDPSLKKVFTNSEKYAQNLESGIKKIPSALKAVSAAAIAAAGAVATVSLKSSIEFETGMTKISSIADMTEKQLDEMGDGIKKLATETGSGIADLQDAVYESISSGVDASEAVKFVEIASKTAHAGFTETATAVDGLTTVMNTYGMQVKDASALADQFIVAQNLGKTTVDEMASSIGNLAPIAKAAGVSTEEMFSSIAVLTANGIKTSEAMTGLKAALSNVIKPAAESAKVAESLGLEFSAAALQSKGLSGFMEDVKAKTGGNLDTMAKLFGSVEGLNTVLTLTSETGIPLFNESMEQMSGQAGLMEEAYNKMATTPQARLDTLMQKLEVIKLEIGEALLPALESIMTKLEEVDFEAVLDGVSKAMQFVADNGEEIVTVVGMMTAGIIAYKAAAALSGVIALFNSLRAAQVAAGTATTVLKTAQLMLNAAFWANPIGIVIGLITALAAGIYLAYQKCEWFRDIVNGLWDAVKWAFGNIADWIEEKMSFVTGIIDGVSGAISWLGEKLGLVEKQAGNVAEASKKIDGGGDDVPKHGDGGFFDRPHLAVVGDRPETIVPQGNTPRNRALLAKAAETVGAPMGNNISITFAPVINGGNVQENKRMLEENEAEFERKMDEYFAKKGRLAF